MDLNSDMVGLYLREIIVQRENSIVIDHDLNINYFTLQLLTSSDIIKVI